MSTPTTTTEPSVKYRIRHRGSFNFRINHGDFFYVARSKTKLTMTDNPNLVFEVSLSPIELLYDEGENLNEGHYEGCDLPKGNLSLSFNVLKKDRKELPVKYSLSLDGGYSKESFCVFTDQTLPQNLVLDSLDSEDLEDCWELDKNLCIGIECTMRYEECECSDHYLDFSCKIQVMEEDKLVLDFGSFLNSGLFSDVTLVAVATESQASKKFAVHRIFLARSPVFTAMLTHDSKEKKEARVVIKDVPANVLQEMLHYMYTDQVQNMESVALGLFQAADKYQLEGLKDKCGDHLIASVNVDTVAETLLLADMHQLSLLKTKCIEFIRAHRSQVKATEGYQKLDSEREDLIAETYVKRMKPDTKKKKKKGASQKK